MSRGRGRPTALTPETAKRILDAISVGGTYEIAAGYGGITERTLYKWIARGENGEEPFDQFVQDLNAAKAKGAIQLLSTVIRAAQEQSWQAAAWILERRHGYTRQPDVVPVSVQIDAEQISVAALIAESQAPVEALKALDGPVIDLDET